MLKLFYTGAAKFNKPNLDASKSLGGYISSSEVPNAFLGNLFGELSRYTIKEGRPEVRCFAIKNTDIAIKTGVKAFFTYPVDNACTYEIGFSPALADNCGDLYTEALNSIYSKPYSVTFHAGKVGSVNALALPNLDPNMYLIIWVRRIISPATQNPPTTQDLLDILSGAKTVEKIEDIGLTFEWA